MRSIAAALAMLTGGCALFLDGGGDGDGDAIGIELSQGDLDPPFAPDHFEYAAQLPFLVSQITVTATGPGAITVDDVAAESGEDSHSLGVPAVGANRTIDVSIDGAVYSVTISRAELGAPVTLMPDEVTADFGFSVAVEDNRVAVGARGLAGDSGDACVFEGGESDCVDSGLATADAFGRSVAIDDDTLIVGAPLADLAYVFVDKGDGWDRQATLDGDGVPCGVRVTNGSGFGNAVAVDGDRAVVAANLEDGNRGAVYIYQRTGDMWNCVQRITRDAGSTDDEFGQSIDLDGNRLVIGANGVNNSTGAVVVYEHDGEEFARPLPVEPPPGGVTAGSQFGFRVDLHRNLLAVSAPTDNDVSDDGFGVVYLFERDDNDDWTEITSIGQNETSITEASELGFDVALDSGTLAIGAPAPLVGEPGRVFVFAPTDDILDTWDLLTTIENGDVNDKLGHSLALDEGVLAIGAPGVGTGQVSVLR